VELTADLLRLGHSVRFTAMGESMHPTIRKGETITVTPVAPSAVRITDIILYQTKTSVIAHRVVGTPERHGAMRAFRVRGDASSDWDEPVAEDQVLGKVVSVERGGRHVRLEGRRVKLFHLAGVLVYRVKRKLDDIGSRAEKLLLDLGRSHSRLAVLWGQNLHERVEGLRPQAGPPERVSRSSRRLPGGR
jgi:signal peptidase